MASMAPTYRELIRAVGRQMRHNRASKGFASYSRVRAAQNFTMPAMSPTMTEGNIASWKVKEGDSFSTGDVLLEIETDKAQMDVEAQDDGLVAKITQGDGAKGVKVGTRIAVLADPDDNISSLDIPAEEAASPQGDAKAGADARKSSESQAEAPPAAKGENTSSSTRPESPSPKRSSARPIHQTYPLYPSVGQLLHEKGIPASEVEKIPASGPKGRLLKGDVLAYLGTINSSYSSDQSARIANLSHLDLSKIKVAPPKQMPSPPPFKPETPSPTLPGLELGPDTEIAVSISLKAVLETQKRIQDTLGIHMPLSTFISRATELANDDLPLSKSQLATSQDQLFNHVLGLDKINPKTSRGSFTPQITALPSTPFRTRPGPSRRPDIIDMLIAKPSTSSANGLRTLSAGVMAGSGPGAAANVFSVSVAKGEEKRARVFLERVKTILQVEPGRLVL